MKRIDILVAVLLVAATRAFSTLFLYGFAEKKLTPPFLRAYFDGFVPRIVNRYKYKYLVLVYGN
ncbi:hypothetical protein OCT63_17055 [Vibrio sp. RW]|nr:hypothetical protein [Vibrio sp. RW]